MKIKRFILIIFLGIISLDSFGIEGQLTSKKQFRIWPRVIFYQAGDFKEFLITMAQSRDQVRKMLLQEFSDTMAPLAMAGGDVVELAKVIKDLILTFDQMHQAHKNQLHPGLAAGFEHQLRAEFDSTFDRYGIPSKLRKAVFLNPDTEIPSRVQTLRTDPNSWSTREDNRKILNGVDFILYGTYSIISNTTLSGTLTLEHVITGEQRNFIAKGAPKKLAQNLAKKLFDFFHKNQYQSWLNPQPKLTWIPPRPNQKKLRATEARAYCMGQNARFPYAKEYVLASQGSQYLSGGIDSLIANHVPYLVADKIFSDDQYYYFYNHQANNILGPVRVDSRNVESYYWCVRGETTPYVKMINQIRRLVRKNLFEQRIISIREEGKDYSEKYIKLIESKIALEFLLYKLDAFSPNCDWYADARLENTSSLLGKLGCRSAFYDINDTVKFLKERNVFINIDTLKEVSPSF